MFSPLDESIVQKMGTFPPKYRERLHRNFDRFVTDVELGPILLELRQKGKLIGLVIGYSSVKGHTDKGIAFYSASGTF